MTTVLLLIYLCLAALLIPANLWAAIVPHLHSDLSMRILHGVSTAALVPLLMALCRSWRLLIKPLAVVLGVFVVVLLVVNLWITIHGMGVAYGWFDHVLLACASASAIAFVTLKPEQPAGR